MLAHAAALALAATATVQVDMPAAGATRCTVIENGSRTWHRTVDGDHAIADLTFGRRTNRRYRLIAFCGANRAVTHVGHRPLRTVQIMAYDVPGDPPAPSAPAAPAQPPAAAQPGVAGSGRVNVQFQSTVPAANLRVTIDWGDGTTTNAGAALIANGGMHDSTGAPANGALYQVYAQHDYTANGSFAVTVHVFDATNPATSVSATTSVTIAPPSDGDITLS